MPPWFQTAPGSPFPAAIVGSASRREKERPLLDPMSDPRPFVFALLKLGLTRHGPGEERFADRRKVSHIDNTRRGDDPGFDLSPCFAATGPQTFPANIPCEGFGRSCLRNRNEVKNHR